jgi:hypothetical protein
VRDELVSSRGSLQKLPPAGPSSVNRSGSLLFQVESLQIS